MILDKLENCEKYVNINPLFSKAFDFLKTVDPSTMGSRVELDAPGLYVIFVKTDGTGHQGAEIEIHKQYIDIQLGISGLNEFGWKPLSDCTTWSVPFDENKDVGFFADAPDLWITAKPGQFAVFFPEDAHTPKGGTGSRQKIVVKVPV